MKPSTSKPLACAAALGTLAALVATQVGSADQPQARTLTFTQRKSPPTFVDLGRKSRGPFNPTRGDLTVFAGRLADQSGRRAGRSQGYCVTADPAHRGEQCSYAFVLADGQIAGAGNVVYGRRFAIPISGGTGAYEGIHGTIRFLVGRKADTIEVTLLP